MIIGFHFSRLRNELLVFTIGLFISLGVGLGSIYYKNEAQEKLDEKKHTLSLLKHKYDNASIHRKIIVEHEESFSSLSKQQLIGAEQRLSWIESIKNISDKTNFLSVKYIIDPMEAMHINNSQINSQHVVINKSTMTIDLLLLHEGDIFYFFNQLEVQAKGLFHINLCNTKSNNSNQSQHLNYTLSTSCELSWYSITNPIASNELDKNSLFDEFDGV